MAFRLVGRGQSRAAACVHRGPAPFTHSHSALQPRLVRAKATATVRDAEAFAATIRQAEEAGDWLTAFEALTEASVMQVTLPPEAMEGGIRTLAQGGQWQRSANLLHKVLSSGGPMPGRQTIMAVFNLLAESQQPDTAQTVLEALVAQGASQEVLQPVHNVVVRVLARSGQAVAAYERLDSMVSGKAGVTVETETFMCVCHELLKSGESEKAEEVLEWRDFLCGD